MPLYQSSLQASYLQTTTKENSAKVYQLNSSELATPNVALHGISRNKVNARTRHVITRSHANGMTRLPCGYAHKNN